MARADSTAGRSTGMAAGPLDLFHPITRSWFLDRFSSPTPAQLHAWPVIAGGKSLLLLAPTGSGKTFAAFLFAIDRLLRRALDGSLEDGITVLYITPLKALGNDIRRNLLDPLEGINGATPDGTPEVRAAVRSGDTPQAERQRMTRHPPHILITTPESLYLLLGSRRMAEALSRIETVIVDEIHDLCTSKRGIHLALSLERLEARVRAGAFQRIGCSATLRPLERIAAFLCGSGGDGAPRQCEILDAGMRKNLDVRVTVPLPDLLEAGNGVLWESAYEILIGEIRRHRTTLIFCNSRYKAERTALRLKEMAGSEIRIGVHHGSMSKERRLTAEMDLKEGRLDALVATSSLELGIDIGFVDLVYQLESPKSITSGLQRIGRAGHLVDATSKGRILVFDRDELLEAACICRGMLEGEFDLVDIPEGCLDVLAQQVAGAVAAGEASDARSLYAVFRRAYPYRNLRYQEFENLLAMLSGETGFQMSMPPKPLLYWERTTGRLSATRGAPHVCSMNVGTIPESGEYEVIIEDGNRRIGKIGSEFVDDSLRSGDVFTLGSSSWKVRGVRRNRMYVEEAPGATPTVPWWTGPYQPRSEGLGVMVGRLRRRLARSFAAETDIEAGTEARTDSHRPAGAADSAGILEREYRMAETAARAAAEYLREQVTVAGVVPDERFMLAEAWRDELGALNLIVHCPLGVRINRTWGAALCEAAAYKMGGEWSLTASNDLILLSRKLSEERDTGIQVNEPALPHPDAAIRNQDIAAVIDAVTPENIEDLLKTELYRRAASASLFRAVATRSLQLLRGYAGKHIPYWLQVIRGQELHDAAQDDQAYSVWQETRRETLHDILDIQGTCRLLHRIAGGDVLVEVKTVESPSPFAHSLLVMEGYGRGGHQMGRHRRAYLLRLHRRVLKQVLSEEELSGLLDARAIARVEKERGYRSEKTMVREASALASAIRSMGTIRARIEDFRKIIDGDPLPMIAELSSRGQLVGLPDPASHLEGKTSSGRDPRTSRHPNAENILLTVPDLWRPYRDAFGYTGRLTVMVPVLDTHEQDTQGVIRLDARPASEVIPARWLKKTDPHEARKGVASRFLACRGPVTLYDLASYAGWPVGVAEEALDCLVDEGKASRGTYDAERSRPQWINRANLEEIHRITMSYLRRELESCAPYEAVDFLTRWQHLHPDTRLSGTEGLLQIIGMLQGYEAVTGAWEPEILPSRIRGYEPGMLDALTASGKVCWRRVGTQGVSRGKVTLCLRRDSEWLACGAPLQFDPGGMQDTDIRGEIDTVRAFFAEHGTAFFDQILEETSVAEGPAWRAVWYLAWSGELTCDTYECLRQADFTATLSACYDLDSTPRKILNGKMPVERVYRQMRRRRLDPRLGRWQATERLGRSREQDQTVSRRECDGPSVVTRWAGQLLRRWGVVTRDILNAESAAPSWAALVPELKRMELTGKALRGYFLADHHGEQWALPEAVELLGDCRARRLDAGGLTYVPDEPVFPMTNRDPANLYAWGADVLDGRCEIMKRRVTQGNLFHRYAVQAGQPLLFNSRQTIALTESQLKRAVTAVLRMPDGSIKEWKVRDWNGYPLEESRVAQVLLSLGFRWNSRKELQYPPKNPGEGDAGEKASSDTEIIPPYYEDGTDVEYGPEYTIAQTDSALRESLRSLLEPLIGIGESRGWRFSWGNGWPSAKYKDTARLHVYTGKTLARVHISSRTFKEDGKTYRMPNWRLYEEMTVRAGCKAGDEFRGKLVTLMEQAESLAERFLAIQDQKKK